MTENAPHRRRFKPSQRAAQSKPHPPRSWSAPELTAALAEIVASGVGERFVSEPLVLPTETYFAEAFTPTPGWYKRVTSRLMAHAGLGDHLLVFDVFDDDDVSFLGGEKGGHATAWFAGLHEEDGRPTCHFGLNLGQLRDPETLVASMAHEVAHAFRAYHGLEGPAGAAARRAGVRDLQRHEEELTDITTHALGFGVLTTNASYRYRQEGGMDGAAVWLASSHSRTGYLSHFAMSQLLAVTLAYRAQVGVADDVGVVLRKLERNQASEVKAKLRAGLDLEAFAARLAVAKTRSSTRGPECFTAAPFKPAPHDDVDVLSERERDESEARRIQNAGLPVFRVPKRQTAPLWPFSSGSIGLRVARVIAFVTTWVALAVYAATPLGAILIGILASVAVDLLVRNTFGPVVDLCSEPECEELQPPGAQTCPGCGGQISGRIATAEDRLGAREALEEAEQVQG